MLLGDGRLLRILELETLITTVTMVIDVNRLETDVSLLSYNMSFMQLAVAPQSGSIPEGGKFANMVWLFLLKTFKHNV